MRRVRVSITPECLLFEMKRSPDVPDDVRYVGCAHDWRTDTIHLYLESPQFAEVEEGAEMPELVPVFHQEARS